MDWWKELGERLGNFFASLARWLFVQSGWLLVLPLVLGFVAVWWLMPQARRRSFSVAVTAGVAGLGVAGLFLTRESGAIVYDSLFYVFASIAVISGTCMIVQTNPVYAALWFAIVILSVCGLFLLQAAPFLAAATAIVYAGAIIVTFIFVIMLAQQTGIASYDRRAREPLLASLAGFILLGGLLYTFQKSGAPVVPRARNVDEAVTILNLPEGASEKAMDDAANAASEALEVAARDLPGWKQRLEAILERYGLASGTGQSCDQGRAFRDLQLFAQELRLATTGTDLSKPRPADPGQVAALGRSLFGDYLYAVELAGTLLLVATIGAIAIVSRREEARR